MQEVELYRISNVLLVIISSNSHEQTAVKNFLIYLDRTLTAARASMVMTTWMMEEVQETVNEERWDEATRCRRQMTSHLEQLAWVLERLFMEEEGLDKTGKKELIECWGRKLNL